MYINKERLIMSSNGGYKQTRENVMTNNLRMRAVERRLRRDAADRIGRTNKELYSDMYDSFDELFGNILFVLTAFNQRRAVFHIISIERINGYDTILEYYNSMVNEL